MLFTMRAGGGQSDVRSLRGCVATGVHAPRASLFISALVSLVNFFAIRIWKLSAGCVAPPPLGFFCDKK